MAAGGGTGHDSRISDTENTRMAKSLRSVGRCRLTVSKPVRKAPGVSTLETMI
jgi:hypothetical protein